MLRVFWGILGKLWIMLGYVESALEYIAFESILVYKVWRKYKVLFSKLIFFYILYLLTV